MGDTRRRAASLLLACVLSASGLCACDDGPVDEPDCRENMDCRLGEICAGGECVPGCAPGASCPGGQRCEDGTCVPNADGDADVDGDADADDDGAPDDSPRDILSTSLKVDVIEQRVQATIAVAPAPRPTVTFEVGDLTIHSVQRGDAGLDYSVDGGSMVVTLPDSDDPVDVTVDYDYQIQGRFEGAMESGVTLTWPYFCGNLFPCHSDPSDGLTFELEVTGFDEGQVAVYPTAIPGPAPSYMLAWAIGDYTFMSLGRTVAGTEIGVWYRPGELGAATAGTEHLQAAFSWFEENLGAYTFGPLAGAVPVSWGPGALGGMEHHPIWHVSTGALGDEETQIHEAAHGWYGNGVRIRCWEDFVMSEGTVTYLAARAIEAVDGPEAGAAVWVSYDVALRGAMMTADMKVAWPDSCGEVDILEDGLFSQIPYMKGAFFFRALESVVGADELLSALSVFYETYVGQAAGMADLLDTIAAQTGYDPTACADVWLRQEDVPDHDTCPE